MENKVGKKSVFIVVFVALLAACDGSDSNDDNPISQVSSSEPTSLMTPYDIPSGQMPTSEPISSMTPSSSNGGVGSNSTNTPSSRPGGTIVISDNDADLVIGSNTIVTETRMVDDFSHLRTSIGDIEIHQCAFQVEVTFDDNLLEHIVVEVENNVLNIGYRGSFRSESRLNIRVCSEALNSINSSGSSDINVLMDVTEFSVNASGSSDIQLQHVGGDRVSFNLSGSTDMTVSGEVMVSDLNVSGSSVFNGRNLVTDRTNISISGTVEATLNASTLSGVVSGVASLLINESANQDIDVRGMATIDTYQ